MSTRHDLPTGATLRAQGVVMERSNPDGTPGLRERRRVRVKLMVQAEALKLFADKGYEQTTIDDIAHAAAMSPRTFFRYFPTKEDVVLWDEYDELPFEELLSSQEHEDPLVRLISAVRRIITSIHDRDRDLLLARTKLSFRVPEIRARFLDQQAATVGAVYPQLALALGGDPEDLGLRVMLSAMFTAMLVAVERWQHDDGRKDLIDVVDEAVNALAKDRPELRAAVAATVRSAAGSA
jgi:AcrR family transcriptional regulator